MIEVSLILVRADEMDIGRIRFINQIKAENSRIDFTLLVAIKQTESYRDNILQIDLVKYADPIRESSNDESGPVRMKQDLAKFELHKLSLDPKTEFISGTGLLRDEWNERQNVCLQFFDVPIKGDGTYAVVAYLCDANSNSNTYAEVKFLDCVYFKVVNEDNAVMG